ncbi:hypothetical protein [Moorena sp. SIO3B2]|uniref:Uncharacterized protein n=1 Tax=Moorena producens (strain JHB) TaxID=1454205 RepID=A0A1D9G0F5_MOOP1|nr:hypothetical protein [Moorena sp. SIO3B2]NEP34866.1 hypothetical protein [Moorena sp. SIO3B2]
MANIKISDLKSISLEFVLAEDHCQELTEDEQLNIQGGALWDWVKNAVEWAVDHLTISTKSSLSEDSGIFIGYKGTHDFPNNI